MHHLPPHAQHPSRAHPAPPAAPPLHGVPALRVVPSYDTPAVSQPDTRSAHLPDAPAGSGPDARSAHLPDAPAGSGPDACSAHLSGAPAGSEPDVPHLLGSAATTAGGPERRPDLRDEEGSLVTEYGLLAVVAATVAGAVIAWASNGALTTLFNALLRQARTLVGA
jgi:Flp pilus assembly pilin Flp